MIKDNLGRTPFYCYTSDQGRRLCNEVIALLQPAKTRANCHVKLPLLSAQQTTGNLVDQNLLVTQIEKQIVP